MTNQEKVKAGARHNKWDKRTLTKVIDLLIALGAVPSSDEGAEGKGADFSMASTQIVVPSEHEISVAHSDFTTTIYPSDLHENGIESYPHITVKYGLGDSDFDAIVPIIESTTKFSVTLGTVGIFERDDFDVIYVNVDSDFLRELNAKLERFGEPSEFETYTPHLTLAYVLPGRGKVYADSAAFVGMTLDVKYIEFSSTENTGTPIELRGAYMPFIGQTHLERNRKLCDAWEKHTRELFESEMGENSFYSYCVDSSDSYVIAYVDGDYFTVPFAVYDDGEIVFSERSRWDSVERIQAWIAKHAEITGTVEGNPVEEIEEEIDENHEADDLIKSFVDNNSDNLLKSVAATDDTWELANHIILWGDSETRDAEGVFSDRVNPDGSIGEWFSKNAEYDSPYTQLGTLYIDFEHGRDILPKDEVLGVVDMKSAVTTPKGLFVKRLLNRQNTYVRWIEELYQKGMVKLATSSEPIQGEVVKSVDGEIKVWPLKRDTITVTPMEPRMYLSQNELEEIKAKIGEEMPEALKSCVLGELTDDECENEQNDDDSAGAGHENVVRATLVAKARKAVARMKANG